MSLSITTTAAAIAASIVNVTFIFLSIRRSLKTPDPILYRTCVLGAPLSGKTTLITRAFEHIFSNSVGRNVSMRGTSTIDVFTENSGRLQRNIPVIRTSTSDVFVFRFDYERKSHSRGLGRLRRIFIALLNPLYRILYKVELADFAGELSLNVAESSVERIADTDTPSNDLIKWALDAQNYVFVVDCSPDAFFSESKANQAKFCQNIWLHLNDIKLDRSNKLHSRNICLYFNKIDALLEGIGQNDLDAEMVQTPKVKNISDNDISAVEDVLLTEYGELIAFFQSQSDQLRLVFGSSFAKDENGEFIGIHRFVSFTLPGG